MISIPVSFLLAALFLALLVSVPFWRALPLSARACFAVLLVMLTLETFFVGLRFAFGVYDFLPLQRVLPVWIAPMAFLSFAALTEPVPKLVRIVPVHCLIAAAATGLVLVPVPVFALPDIVIALSYTVYAGLLAHHWRRGPDELSQIPTRLTERWHRIEASVLAAMIATLVVDSAIAFLFSRAQAVAAVWLVSLATIGLLAGVAGLLLWLSMNAKIPRSKQSPPAPSGERADIVDKATKVLVDQELFRDPALTATRLARRVSVPDRELSRAINGVTGLSISQFVNQYRLDDAARLLRSTDAPTTQILEQSGFLTRSNFYKEFQKRFGMPPGDYRRKAQERRP